MASPTLALYRKDQRQQAPGLLVTGGRTTVSQTISPVSRRFPRASPDLAPDRRAKVDFAVEVRGIHLGEQN